RSHTFHLLSRFNHRLQGDLPVVFKFSCHESIVWIDCLISKKGRLHTESCSCVAFRSEIKQILPIIHLSSRLPGKGLFEGGTTPLHATVSTGLSRDFSRWWWIPPVLFLARYLFSQYVAQPF